MSLPMQRFKRLIVTIGQSNRRVSSSSCSALVLCARLFRRGLRSERRAMNLPAQISSFHLTVIALGLLLSVPPAASQEFRGSISGRVTDSTGAAARDAKVTITNIATKVSENTTTDDAGNYSVLYLTPGQYQIWVEAPGFKKLERSGIELRIGDRLAVDLQLELGTMLQEVHVTAGAPALPTTEASAGQALDPRPLQGPPLPPGGPLLPARLFR